MSQRERHCLGCGGPLSPGLLSYCSTTCLKEATARRRRRAAERSRLRRAMADHPASARKEGS